MPIRWSPPRADTYDWTETMKMTNPYLLPAVFAGVAFLWLAADTYFSDRSNEIGRRFALLLAVLAIYPLLDAAAHLASSISAARLWFLVAELHVRVIMLILFEFVVSLVSRRWKDPPVRGARVLVLLVCGVTGGAALLGIVGMVPREFLIPNVVRTAGLYWEGAGPLLVSVPLFLVVGSFLLVGIWYGRKKRGVPMGGEAPLPLLRGAFFMLLAAGVLLLVKFPGSGGIGGVPFSFVVDVAFLGMALGISAFLRRMSLADLRRERDTSETIIDTMGDGLAMLDPDGTIRMANRRLADMLGYEADELVGLSGKSLFHPWPPESKPSQRLLRRKDGTDLAVLVNCVPKHNGEGRTPGSLYVFTDVSSITEMTRELENKAREISGLHEVAATAGQSLDLSEMLSSTLRVVRRLMRMDGGAVYVVNEDRGELRLLSREGARLHGTRVLSEADEYRILEEIARTREAVLCSDVSADPSLSRSYVRPLSPGAFIAIPLASKGRMLGAICLSSTKPRTFAEDDRRLVAAMGAEIGVSVENAMLFEEAGRRGVELLLLHELGQLMTAASDEEALCAHTVKKCAEEFQAECCLLALVDESDKLHLRATHCLRQEDKDKITDVIRTGSDGIRSPLAKQVLKSGEAVVSNMGEHGIAADAPLGDCLAGKRWMMLPIRSNASVIGVMVLASADRSRWFSSRDLFMMQEIASQTGRALERLRLFAEIEESERKYRSLIESASDGVFLCDENGRITYASRRMAQITGRSAETLLTLTVSDVFDEESAKAAMEAVANVSTSPTETRIVDGLFRHSSGQTVPVQVGYTGVDFPDGGFAVQGIMRDLSHEVEAEQLKSDLISMVSHELRSPLTLIAGYSAVLRRDDLVADPEKRSLAACAIDAQVQRMLELIEELLLASTIEHGALETKRQPVDLAKMAESLVEAYRSSGDKHTVTREFSKGFPKIMADPRGMELVLANLLSNAIKYSPEGGHVVVSGTAQNGCVHVTVADQGIGVEDNEREKIFRRFYQSDMTSTRSYGGIGLGLFLSKKIVEAHGGTIDVESEVGRGSKFMFCLPAAKTSSR